MLSPVVPVPAFVMMVVVPVMSAVITVVITIMPVVVPDSNSGYKVVCGITGNNLLVEGIGPVGRHRDGDAAVKIHIYILRQVSAGAPAAAFLIKPHPVDRPEVDVPARIIIVALRALIPTTSFPRGGASGFLIRNHNHHGWRRRRWASAEADVAGDRDIETVGPDCRREERGRGESKKE